MNEPRQGSAVVHDKPRALSAVQNTLSGVQRLPELDALRGIAAFSVVLWHFYCATFPMLPGVQVISWFSRGDGAVVLFFILSGFVLSLPFQREARPPYSAFVIRRICRIYLPYLAGIAVSFLVVTFVTVSRKPELSAWFNMPCGVPFNARVALEHLFLIGNIHSNTYNCAIWSLIHEMRVSLVFPLLFWGVSRNKIVTNLILCFILSAFADLDVRWNLETSNGFQTGYFYSLHVASLFIIGILLAQYREELVRAYRRIPTPIKVLVFLVALVAYRVSMRSSIFFLKDNGVACAAAVFIVSALGATRISTILRKPFFTFLGNISYALYLNHLTFIYLILYVCYPALPLWPLCIVIIAMTMLFSYAFWKYIERPSISLGKSLVQLFCPQR
jgi:peptidoglycan/LPS O-acetylase OafA/YrhL